LNNDWDEFEDLIPNNSTYILGSCSATAGNVEFNSENNKIIWNGEIETQSSVSLNFNIKINSSLINGSIISNQGFVNWDSNEDMINDSIEFTDDPHINDGIDQDGDGYTDDDDPTILYTISFEPPSTLCEDFSDDDNGKNAEQYFLNIKWFETTFEEGECNFEVAGYRYLTSNSFKTKLRSSCSPQYWNYNLSALESNIESWEIWFKCGNVTEESDLYLTFKNDNDIEIAKIKFEYIHLESIGSPLDHLLEIYYWSPIYGWVKLNSPTFGYLYNNWYKLRIERNGGSYINYSLAVKNIGLVEIKTDLDLTAPFSDLSYIEFHNTKEPIVCPIFFWDDHQIGLIKN